jgi:uncharacterized protein YbaA (DUF1428 family)
MVMYIDGFICAVPSANRKKYQNYAALAAKFLKENGALRVVECWGNDVPEGKLTSFPMAVKCQPDETVVFSWIEWPSRQVRDEGMKIMMTSSLFDPKTNPMPLDGARVIFGGFEPIIDI